MMIICLMNSIVTYALEGMEADLKAPIVAEAALSKLRQSKEESL